MHHEIRWTAKKIAHYLDLITPLTYIHSEPLAEFQYTELDAENRQLDFNALDAYDWQPLPPHTYWGQPDTNFLLRTTFAVPADWDDTYPTALFLPIGDAGTFIHPETLVYIDGKSIAAIDRYHQEIILPSRYCDGKTHEIVMHGWTGNIHNSGVFKHPQLSPCTVVQIHQPTRDLIAITRNALGSTEYLDDTTTSKHTLLNALNNAYRLLDVREPLAAHYYASVETVLSTLRSELENAGAPMDVTISATGHAHIDVAWLWTVGQTRNKARRTFHTVDLLMDQFPEYLFTQSQPQLYDYIRQDDPALFERIKARVAEGRWELTGGMWVEADCNLTGAEALARQFLLGRSFFKAHFGEGKESPVLWLPDVFGYSWALPQLIKLAGLEYFMTIKISWNQYNKMPYDSFWWEGIDGTQVLTHFSPTPNPTGERANYNARVTPRESYVTWKLFQQKAEQNHLLMIFGHGDGGGGPTREMLENIQVMKSLPGMPQIQHDTALDFFQRMEAESAAALPTWNGELYFELHRGTYTSQARNKQGNRRSEFLLHDVELLGVVAGLLDPAFDYPQAALQELWELVCLNQFHDIIPGSSINQVYVESLEQYAYILNTGRTLRDQALATIHNHTGGDLLVVNPNAFEHHRPVIFWSGELAADQQITHGDETLSTQPGVDGGTWIQLTHVEPHGIYPLTIMEGGAESPESTLSASPQHLENKFIRVEFDDNGDITRIYDKLHRRDVLATGAIGNQLQAFEDRPMDWDAWDIDIYYDDKMWTSEPAESVEVLEDGPLHVALKITRRILSSPYTQIISLTCDSPQITIDTDIDWRERHILLKAAFPVDVLSPQATYEIQWGHVQRPTHHNTSWDWARFETVAHKWVDLSEGGYGVSLLNDCKYGHDIHQNVMRISLLRGSSYPDPTADLAQHRFTYALLPHGELYLTQTISSAYTLNDPYLVYQPVQPIPVRQELSPLVYVDQSNIVIEAVKRAEDGNGIIVRLYESQRRRGDVTLRTGFDIETATVTNLLEEAHDEPSLTAEDRRISFKVTPFQIVTLRIIPAEA
jgi:alpha-mannosidase